jgi:hypothetical protein
MTWMRCSQVVVKEVARSGTVDGITPPSLDGVRRLALDLLAARAALEAAGPVRERDGGAADGLREALAELQGTAALVLGDLDDQSSGWYYQFKAAVEKAEAILKKSGGT